MSSPQVDLEGYFTRVGYDGPRTPTLETLRALHELHPAAIPFEAIDVLLDRGIDLAPAAVDAKLITARRGGYCFEQNSLFQRVLTALGFQVEGLIARVLWQAPADAPTRPRSHKALRVTIDGEAWLADVGFGGQVYTAPLRMVMDAPQPTQHESYRLRDVDGEIRVEAELEGLWAPLYQVSRQAQVEADYEPANWFTATHPSSHFRHDLLAARTTPQARYALLHNRFTVRRPGEPPERRTLDTDQIERLLAEEFGLPVQPDWRPLFERAVAAGG